MRGQYIYIFNANYSPTRAYTAVRAILVLVQRSQAQGTDVACGMVAGSNRMVANGTGANEADIGVVVRGLFLPLVPSFECWRFAGL